MWNKYSEYEKGNRSDIKIKRVGNETQVRKCIQTSSAKSLSLLHKHYLGLKLKIYFNTLKLIELLIR